MKMTVKDLYETLASGVPASSDLKGQEIESIEFPPDGTSLYRLYFLDGTGPRCVFSRTLLDVVLYEEEGDD
jgi:hypothetical protein